MLKKTQSKKARRNSLMTEARAGLIPASDDVLAEIHARLHRTAQTVRTVNVRAKRVGFGSDRGAIAAMLADLRHYCENIGMEFRELDRVANEIYEEERAFSYSLPFGGLSRPPSCRHGH